MDPFRIYEELRESLGEAAARSLAATLGSMFDELRETVTKDDLRSLRDAIDADLARVSGTLVSLADAQRRTDERVAELAEAQGRTEARIAELAEAQRRTDERVGELAEAQRRTDERVGELAEAQRRTDERVGELAVAQRRTDERVGELAEAQKRTEETLQRLSVRVDKVVGDCFEQKFRDRLPAYLGLFLRRARLVDIGELIDRIESRVTDSELTDLLRADAIASGVIGGEGFHLVIEASVTADAEDVIRAKRRAGVLEKAGLRVIPLVACEGAAEVTRRQARDADVRLWIDGVAADAA
ncbi:MAG: hypothetical protein FJ309_13980 [Planctomycetes bacterium]|nr:hypothetical protein [Planctomycetota bacterium]MBM4012614.1 hypothetical protein [Planctomycetota bacterium]